jgi:protein TonB
MPVYPPIAAAAHVSGQIEIQIVVGLDGKITNVGMPVGPAMLRASAVEAVKEWTFKPYRIGTHPVPFTTLITFQFTTTGTHSEKIQSIP